jgi:hypothetical protein
MARFTVRGVVTGFGPNQRNIRVENADELRRFWADERIVTRLDWAGDDPPLVTIGAKEFVSRCQPGDRVDYTIETWDRRDGRRIRGVSLTMIEPAPSSV